MLSIYWYCCLAILGVGIAAFSIYKKRHIIQVSTFIGFYIFSLSITWIGEFVALGIFNGYAYKPGKFIDPWAQNLLAHLIINSTLWPGAATLVVAFSLGYGWMSFITGVFLLIEYLFAQLGIYEQHWWKYYMSAIIVFAFLVISKKWFAKMNHIRRGLIRNLTFFFIALAVIHVHSPILLLLGKKHYNVGIVENMYLSSTIFTFSFHIVQALILVIFVSILKKWYWKLVPLIIDFVFQSALLSMNILIFGEGWNLFYTMLFYAISLGFFILLEKYTLKPRKIDTQFY